MSRQLVLSVIVALALTAAPTQAELVAHWRFDEGSGTVAADSSGNGNDGTLEGDAVWVAGQIGDAIQFNGSNARVVAPHIPLNNQSFTVTMWINPELYTNQQTVFSQVETNATNTSLHFRLGGPGGTIPPPGGVRMGFYSNDLDAPDGLIEDNNWYHLTFWYDFENQNRRIYIDGEQVAEAASTPYLGAAGDTVIGSWGTGEWFRGIIDDVQVYDHALSDGEVQGAMQGQAWPYALGPKPGNGDLITTTSALLEWNAGSFAALHDVYFGTDSAAVGGATPDDADVYVGRQATEMLSVGMAGGPMPEGLTPGETYYWRVDEVNDTEPNSPWKGDVWSFMVQPLIAWDPTPADGLSYVRQDQQLTWQPGMNNLFHTIYFGESFDEVNDAVAGGWMSVAASYDPGPLEGDTTYYWRVDQFTPTGTRKGDVWSFTTVPAIEVTDPNLVGWWTFDQGMGITAVDSSGYGNHGVLVGDPQWVGGYYGDALAFDGSSYVNCGNGPSLTINDEITIAFWFQVETFANTWEAFLAKGDDSYRASRSGSGDATHMGISGTSTGGGNGWFNGTVIVTGGAWHHYAATYDGTEGRIYIDGELDVTSPGTGQINTSGYDLWIGSNSQNTGRLLNGLMDDVRIYNRALAEDEINVVMRGNPLLAALPEPSPGAVVDYRDATALSWQAGETAASHDVYFGTDKEAVAGAGTDAPEYRGNQPGVSFSLAGLVEFGGGDYFWRIDEVEADGTVQTGYTWQFTIPDYLIVDDFESYTNDVGNRVFQTWIDGLGFSEPVETPGNGSGALVGHDIWTPGTPYTEIMETGDVYAGRQAMPVYYDNTGAPGYSRADRTFAPAQDWTVEGVTTLVVHFRGEPDNTGDLYVEINGMNVPYSGDAADIASPTWIAWEIDLASTGVNPASVRTLSMGIEGGQTGVLYVDDIRLTKAAQ